MHTVKTLEAYGGVRALLDIDDIKEYLNAKKYNFITDVRLRPSDETIMLYVLQDKVAPKAKAGITSARQLIYIKKALVEKYQRQTEVIFIQDDAQQELESGFYQMLNRKFNNQITSLYISFKEESFVDAFIEASNLNDQLQDSVTTHFKDILDDANLKLGELQWLISSHERPSFVAILRVLKTYQPVDLSDFAEEIQKRYQSVSIKWLSHKLDQLRKKGLVLRQKEDATYVLTEMSLRVIPSGKRRTSSDIDRALALGVKKW